jgi:hypothetical protein
MAAVAVEKILVTGPILVLEVVVDLVAEAEVARLVIQELLVVIVIVLQPVESMVLEAAVVADQLMKAELTLMAVQEL